MSVKTSQALETLLVGFGKIAAANAQNPHADKHTHYATHAQVLKDHPHFRWRAVVDPDPAAQQLASQTWGVEFVASALEELPEDYRPEVVVLATPPDDRLKTLRQLPDSVKAVLLEKPLALDLKSSEAILEYCRQRGWLVQINLVRRADTFCRQLHQGELAEKLGYFQAGTSLYGRGLWNNGIHMIDLARMLLGEPQQVTTFGASQSLDCPLKGDLHLAFALGYANHASLVFQFLNFKYYREVSLDLWGSSGRLALWSGGLSGSWTQVQTPAGLAADPELPFAEFQTLPMTLGQAMYRMYDNLWETWCGHSSLWSDGENYLKTVKIVDLALQSWNAGGQSQQL